MYFLTNNENNIIAASSDFLTTIGSRDVCSISAMLQNKLIILDDSKLTIPNKDLEYECKISTMYSAFGNLNLHTLSELSSIPQTEEESIAKLQDSTPKKKDNEYDIPDIPTLHKEETTKVEDTEVEEKPLDDVQTIHNESIELADENAESSKDEKEIDNETIDTKELEVSKENKEKVDTEDSKEKIETKEPKNNELIEILKNLDTDTDNDEKSLNISTDNSIEKLAEELIDTENKEDESNTIQDSKPIETAHNIDKIIEHSTVDNEIINQLKETEDTNIKENGLKKITKKLFPWSNKKSQTIELEEDNTPYEIDLKSASELEDKTKDVKTNNSINNDEAIKIEEAREEIHIPEIPSIALEQERIENEQENISINNEPELKVENIEPEKELLTIESDEIEAPEIPSISIEEEPNDISTNSANKVIEPLEKIELANTEDNKINLENKDINLEKTVQVENTEDKETNQEISTLKEQISNIDIQEKKEKIEDKNNIINTQDTELESIENNSIAYKVIKLQVEGIDFEKNANKLSIDKSSYKMLLANYLDEIEKYNNELENGTTSTIDMLQDAGKLLSLDILTQRLGQLKQEGDRASFIKEISLISSLLKEKMDKKAEAVATNEEPKVEESEVIEEEEISTPAIPDDIIDITSAQDLLTSITPQSVSFNPNRAAEELNLPKTLIIEFIEDFIAQSKEHLPVLVEAYKKEDIKTIQTTAHMLKGAASNLRLDTIAENLFKIQKESNINNSAELIKQFVAKLKGLSSEVASLEDAEDEN